MNIEARELLRQAERAIERGNHATARACFLEAGDSAVAVQLWRAALRCYRRGLELDLLDRELVHRIRELPGHVSAGRGWADYATAIDRQLEWLSFDCRSARVVIGARGAFVECARVGPVLDVAMRDGDLFEVRPILRFAGMPLAMGMIIMCRALWPAPMRLHAEPARAWVAFDGSLAVMLDELGDWDAAPEPVRAAAR